MPEAKTPKMTTNELVARLEGSFPQDVWKEASQTESGEFSGPDGRYHARLSGIYFGNTKKGDLYFNFGFFVLEGPCKGQKLQKFLQIKETQSRTKEECLGQVMADFKMLGATGVAGSPPSKFPEFIKELTEMKPTTWLRTRTSRWEDNSGQEQSMLYVDILGEVDDPASPHTSSHSPSRASQDSSSLSTFGVHSSWPALIVGADAGDKEAIDEVVRRASLAGVDHESADFPTWKDVADAVQSPPEKPSTIPSTSPSSLTEDELNDLAVKADNGDGEAALILEETAFSLKIDAGPLASWEAVVTAILAASDAASSTPPSKPSPSTPQKEWRPEKGEVYLFAYRAGLEAVPCKVHKVYIKAKLVDLVRETDSKMFQAVAWDKLGQAVS